VRTPGPTHNPRGARDNLENLRELRAEFPGWWFRIDPGRLAPWVAQRERGDALVWRCGVMEIETSDPELLRAQLLEVALIDAAHARPERGTS
jgi:hypothetical protein